MLTNESKKDIRAAEPTSTNPIYPRRIYSNIIDRTGGRASSSKAATQTESYEHNSGPCLSWLVAHCASGILRHCNCKNKFAICHPEQRTRHVSLKYVFESWGA